MTDQPTEQQLDEIETRAAHLYEYADPTDAAWEILAGDDVPQLLAELRRLRARVAELEVFAYGCDAEGCVLPHSSWCDAAKKTAAANKGCTCGKPWTGHPQPHAMHCWTVNPPRSEVEEMRKRIAELSVVAASVPPGAPVRPSQPSSVSESAQSPTGAAEGRLVDLPSPEDLASADNPTHLRWGLNDVLWSDDDSVIVMLSGPDLEAYWLELDPERAAVLREDLAGPAEDAAPDDEFTGTQPCGHDDYHSGHPWADRPDVWCAGH